MRNTYFLGYIFIIIALYFTSLKELAGLSLHDELYSHFLLIPVVSLYFIFVRRKLIFSDARYSFRAGFPVAAFGILIYILGKSFVLEQNQNDYLSVMMFSFLTCFIGGFILFYGIRAFRKAMFPLLFLIFIVPIPTFILEPFIRVLLIGSTESSHMVFKVLGVPVFRRGFVFELTGITVEVAKECSGIRSSLALFITSILAGQLFLRTWQRRVILTLCIFPITIFKNSLRIATITLLASYVDPIFLKDHWIHSAGGQPFFVMGLLLLLPVMLLLRRSEKKKLDSSPASDFAQ